ncbi:P-type conjugative transfer protein VirB9 [Microcoleus sp. MON1_C5]
MRNKISTGLFAVCLAVTSSTAMASKTPQSLSSDSRVRHVMYDPNQVYEIIGTYGYQTSLEFATDEEVKVVSLGDTIAWQTVPYNNRVFLKPVEPRAATNMTVITNKRTYYFMLSSTKLSKETTFLVRFKYPQTTSTVATMQSKPKIDSTGFDPETINLDYSTSGHKHAILLNRVLDDGQFTFFRFDEKGEIPTIYTVGPDGTESIVNTRREGSYLVVERTAGLFTLRNGNSYLCVRNNSIQSEIPKSGQLTTGSL